MTLHATLHPVLRKAELLLQAQVPAGKSIGWLGMGLSADGNMGGGSFMMGWGAPVGSKQQGCVVASSLPIGASEAAPTGPAGFLMHDTGFFVYDGYAFLELERPLHDNLAGHISIPLTGPLHVMYAAGSTAPSSCAAKPEPANYHDVYHASKLIQIKSPVLRAAARSMPPAPPPSSEHPPAQFARLEGASVQYMHELGYTVIEDTIVSQSYFLKDGDLVFTQFDDTILPMPGDGDYAVLSLVGGLVDCNNESVPLDIVYNHHWLMKPVSGPTTHYNSPCPNGQDFSYVFGVGAESRLTPTVMPEGYGYHVRDGTKWGANIHLLHTQGLAGGDQGTKECIECWAGPRKACGLDPKRNGSFSCCQTGTCPVAPDGDGIPTEYKMQMTIKYTRNVSMVKPVDMETYL